MNDQPAVRTPDPIVMKWAGLTRALCVVVVLLMLAAIIYACSIAWIDYGQLGV